tara:strand:- start:338 stop:625 length:288 start_codon:yes stop_codon:yes gene_type:complete
MYKFTIIGTLHIDGKNYKAGDKGLIVESKELAERIKSVIGSGYITLGEEKKELTPAEKGALTKKLNAEAKALEKEREEIDRLKALEDETPEPSED